MNLTNNASIEAAASGAARLEGFGGNRQVAVITDNARRDIDAIGAALGAGSFKFALLDQPAIFGTMYDGEPGNGSMLVGITWIGEMLIEVIQPLGDRNVYAAYLARRDGRPGVQHIFLERDGIDYDDAIARLTAAGVPPRQHGRMNAKGRFGFLNLPPMPQRLANRYATRFCYTGSFEQLGLDIELSHFAFGVPYRTGLRLAAPDEWIPPERPRHFETVPDDSILRDVDAVYVLSRDIEELAAGYARLADTAPAIRPFCDDVLPGDGMFAQIWAGQTKIVLVAPSPGSILEQMLEREGEGIEMISGPANGTAIADRLSARGWDCQPGPAGLLATHDHVPFALWMKRDD